MAWTPLHDSLPDHPKLELLALALGVSIPQAVGHVVMLWAFALRFAADGDLTKYPDQVIAKKAGWTDEPKRFVAALADIGWLDADHETGAIALHDWAEYGGKIEDKRRNDRERKRKSDDVPRNSNGIPSEVARKSGGSRNDSTLREEKRREEESREHENPPNPPGGKTGSGSVDSPSLEEERPKSAKPKRPTYTPEFLIFWEAYPNKIAKPEASELFAALRDEGVTVADLLEGIERWKASATWKKDGGAFVMNPARWLRNREFEAEPAAASAVAVAARPNESQRSFDDVAVSWLEKRREQRD